MSLPVYVGRNVTIINEYIDRKRHFLFLFQTFIEKIDVFHFLLQGAVEEKKTIKFLIPKIKKSCFILYIIFIEKEIY